MDKLVWTARYRLVWLWFSQTARTLANYCFLVSIIVGPPYGLLPDAREAAYRILPFFVFPFLVFAPWNAALSNTFPKRWVLTGAAVLSFLVLAISFALLGPLSNSIAWRLALAFYGVGAAVYSPACYALLPSAAHEAQLPLS